MNSVSNSHRSKAAVAPEEPTSNVGATRTTQNADPFPRHVTETLASAGLTLENMKDEDPLLVNELLKDAGIHGPGDRLQVIKALRSCSD